MLTKTSITAFAADSAADKVRQTYLQQLQNRTKRNIICYYSGWLSKPNIEGMQISDEDANGFVLCAQGLDRALGLDLFLHTPGGSGPAAEFIVQYLKKLFGNNIRAFIPQIAMSAGTIVACACKEIFMGRHSSIGPVHPQVSGHADEQLTKTVKESIKISLAENMFLGQQDAQQRAAKIVTWLTDLSKDHDHQIYYDDCRREGLKVRPLEADRTLQDLVLTIHDCYMFMLANTGCFKVVENHLGRRWLKVQRASPARTIASRLVLPSRSSLAMI